LSESLKHGFVDLDADAGLGWDVDTTVLLSKERFGQVFSNGVRRLIEL
jgi:hypothetical protein